VVNEVHKRQIAARVISPKAWREADTDYASVAMRFSLIDNTTDRATGRVVDNSRPADRGDGGLDLPARS